VKAPSTVRFIWERKCFYKKSAKKNYTIASGRGVCVVIVLASFLKETYLFTDQTGSVRVWQSALRPRPESGLDCLACAILPREWIDMNDGVSWSAVRVVLCSGGQFLKETYLVVDESETVRVWQSVVLCERIPENSL